MNVLVLDDSSAMRAILCKIMKELGHSTLEAENGREGLDKLASAPGPVELALVDWNMPEMDGLQFVTEVRRDPKHNDMRILMVTTETEMMQVVRAIEAGANEYVMKPFTRDVIIDKLRLIGIGS